MNLKLYKSYGVLAHEYKPVYTLTAPVSDIYDVITVKVPEGVKVSKNEAGETVFEFEDAPKQVFTARESLTNRGENPVLRYWDFEREGANATEHWKELKDVEQ